MSALRGTGPLQPPSRVEEERAEWRREALFYALGPSVAPIRKSKNQNPKSKKGKVYPRVCGGINDPPRSHALPAASGRQKKHSIRSPARFSACSCLPKKATCRALLQPLYWLPWWRGFLSRHGCLLPKLPAERTLEENAHVALFICICTSCSFMEDPTPESTPWWGTFSLGEGTGGCWEVGPTTLWLYRSANDWRIIHRQTNDPTATDPMVNRSAVRLPVSEAEMNEVLATEDPEIQTTRYSFQKTESQITLEPVLADRPVVSRPEHPLYVPTGESVTLYLSTPVWIRIELKESERQLQEVPSHRMSDTWLGPSTLDGELCYATRTSGRLRLEHLPVRLHRAITPLRIENRAEDSLLLERVQLPAEHLALYRTTDEYLWTNAVSMSRITGTEGASVNIEKGPPKDIQGAARIQEPRREAKKGLFTSTFRTVGALFGS